MDKEILELLVERDRLELERTKLYTDLISKALDIIQEIKPSAAEPLIEESKVARTVKPSEPKEPKEKPAATLAEANSIIKSNIAEGGKFEVNLTNSLNLDSLSVAVADKQGSNFAPMSKVGMYTKGYGIEKDYHYKNATYPDCMPRVRHSFVEGLINPYKFLIKSSLTKSQEFKSDFDTLPEITKMFLIRSLADNPDPRLLQGVLPIYEELYQDFYLSNKPPSINDFDYDYSVCMDLFIAACKGNEFYNEKYEALAAHPQYQSYCKLAGYLWLLGLDGQTDQTNNEKFPSVRMFAIQKMYLEKDPDKWTYPVWYTGTGDKDIHPRIGQGGNSNFDTTRYMSINLYNKATYIENDRLEPKMSRLLLGPNVNTNRVKPIRVCEVWETAKKLVQENRKQYGTSRGYEVYSHYPNPQRLKEWQENCTTWSAGRKRYERRNPELEQFISTNLPEILTFSS